MRCSVIEGKEISQPLTDTKASVHRHFYSLPSSEYNHFGLQLNEHALSQQNTLKTGESEEQQMTNSSLQKALRQ